MLTPALQEEIKKFYKGKLLALRLSGFVLTFALIAFLALFFFKIIGEAFLCVGMLYVSGMLFNVFASLSAIKLKKVVSGFSTLFSILLYLASLALMIWQFIVIY